MLQHFFGSSGLTPDHVTAKAVFAWADGIGLSGRQPSSTTVGARVACLSSFYRFLIRMGLVTANPCDALERPRAVPGTPRGLTAEAIQRLLGAIPETPSGLRDRAIILTLTLTGRRRVPHWRGLRACRSTLAQHSDWCWCGTTPLKENDAPARPTLGASLQSPVLGNQFQ